MISKETCKKILLIGCNYQPPRGGVAQVLQTYSTTIFQEFNFLPTTIDKSKFSKLKLVCLSFIRFIKILLSREVMIIHIHGSSYSSFFRKSFFILVAKIFRKKVIYHNHTGDKDFKQFTSKYKPYIKFILKLCDVVITLSSVLKVYFENEFELKRVVVIKNVIDYPIYYKRVKVPTIVLTFLGYIDERKGIFDLLQIMADNKSQYEGKLFLNIGGNGETEKLINFINQRGINKIVKFNGWLDKEKKQELLSNTDVFILPSYSEGLPISILEALSYKLPIISTPVGGIPEIVENGFNGFLVAPGDQNQIKKAIDFFITDPSQCERMGLNSFSKVKSHFPDQVENELIHLYESLLN